MATGVASIALARGQAGGVVFIGFSAIRLDDIIANAVSLYLPRSAAWHSAKSGYARNSFLDA